MRMHERESFFKYTSAEVAQIIMRNGSLRWSSPIIFNDPFDVVRQMAEGITPANIQECIIEVMIELIDSEEHSLEGFSPKLRCLLGSIRKSNDPIVKRKIIGALNGMRSELVQRSEGLEELRAMWKDLLPDLRILCLSEEKDNAPMWYHYAEQYTGVVFEFSCIPRLDSAWLVAKAVNYPHGNPMLSEATGWAKLLMMGQDTAARLMIHESIYTKAEEWSYEKEWRIQIPKRGGESGYSSDWRFHRDELTSVYLGPRIDNEHREQIVALRSKLYPHASVFEGSIGRGNRITFQQIV